ncbi:MAG: family 1 glycosylhydrolase [Minisyncoccales bacterium]|jgi:beta-glucosidase
MNLYFPKGFLWGASTSAHQVEGNNQNDWSVWEKVNAQRLASLNKNRKIKFPQARDPQNYISGRAADHYNRFSDDFQIASSMGHNAHRFSIEWSRIEPQEGVFDQREIDHYRKVISSLKEKNMKPLVTLWHWTLPIWLKEKGGLLNPEFPNYFSRYTQRMADEYHDLVSFWMTLNEPTSVISNAYIKGFWPPQKRNPIKALIASKNLAQAHKSAYKVIKERDLNASVGVGHIMTMFCGVLSSLNIFNRTFLSLCGPENQDYISLQYYFSKGFRAQKFSDMGWPLHPEGIYPLLMKLKKYKKPIYITENGLADADDLHRRWYIEETLKSVMSAIKEGVDVRGYFHWSLIDNFEWDKGFWPRFGLVEIDYKTLDRKPRPSSDYYSKICKNNHL